MNNYLEPWVRQAREDCPSCQSVLHLNNAGSSLPPQSVVRRQLSYLEEEAQLGGYECAARYQDEIDQFYSLLTQLFGGQPTQYAWCTSATDAYFRALSAVPFQSGDVILTTRNDYTSNFIAFFQLIRFHQVQVVVAEDLPQGGVDLNDFEQKLKAEIPRLVAVTQVPSHTGIIQPVEMIGQLCQSQPCWYLIDGCQAAGQLPIDLEQVGCDFYTATFRKFLRGPRGAGFLYISDRVIEEHLEPRFLDLHGASWTGDQDYQPKQNARRFELWERSYSGMLGAKEALHYLVETGGTRIQKRVGELTKMIQEELLSWPSARVLYPEQQLQGIITVHFENQEPEALQAQLRAQGVHISFARREQARLGMPRLHFPWVLRFSPHYYNTEAEIQRSLGLLHPLVA